ncbi:CBS domain-containing protein [Candidatus Bathyarchaeota archaeon]|nr:CBS domain-containing protein [Candidatus Bathyarchaeota archaeon]
MLPELGEIAIRRSCLGMTQANLAFDTGISRSLIAKIEGGRVNPSYAKAKKIFTKLEEKERARKPSLPIKSLGEICSEQIEYADSEELVIDVQIRMAGKSLSQLPVRTSGGHIIGSITERRINKAYTENETSTVKYAKVSSIMEDPFPTLSAATPFFTVIGLLQQYQAVLVQEHGKIIGIASNADIAKVFQS